jgi:hypothetical protein
MGFSSFGECGLIYDTAGDASNGHRSTPSGDEPVIQTPSFTKPQTWYPTLRKTENVISLLHGCVKVSRITLMAHSITEMDKG